MKVALVSYVGNVGKTVLGAHMLAPRMGDAPIFAIETINETASGLGLTVEKFKGDAFRQIFKRLINEEHAIIDVGASNIEDFMSQIVKFEEAHDEIDFFVVPVLPGTREQKEAVKTVEALAAIGVPREKIRPLFNRFDSDVKSEYTGFLVHAQKLATVNYDAVVENTELFDMLANYKTTIGAVLADETDYRAQLRQTPKDQTKEISRLSDRHMMKAMAKPMNRKLDQVFEALFS